MSSGKKRKLQHERQGRRQGWSVDQWLAGHRATILAVIIGISVLLRIVHFLQLREGPCLRQHLWQQTDMNFFDTWARQISEGDLLTDQALHPLHNWHKEIAATYFRLHPQQATTLAQEAATRGESVEPARLLWNRWYGEKSFHQEPLYPYLIALTYKLAGTDPRWVFVWQMLLGVLSNVLVYVTTRRFFGDTAAALAGLLAVSCSPLIYYETLLLRAAPLVFATMAVLYVTDKAARSEKWTWWLLAGVSFGLAILLKSIFAVFALGVLCVVFVRYVKRPKKLLVFAGSAVGGIAVCIVPLVARNVAVGAPPLSLSSVASITYLNANVEDYPPDIGFFVSQNHAARIMAKTGGSFLPTVLETLKTHNGLGSYLGQSWGKVRAVFHWYETPNNANFYFYQLHSWPLRFLPVTFGVIAPLSVVGLAIAGKRFRYCWALYLLTACSLVPLLAFYTLSRFRTQLLVTLIPFAALAVVQLVRLALKKHWLPLFAALCAVILLFLVVNRPLPPGRPRIRAADYAAVYVTYYGPQAKEAYEAGDWRRAADAIGRLLQYEPSEVKQMGPLRPVRNYGEQGLARFFSQMYRLHAQLLSRVDSGASARELRRAKELEQAASRADRHGGQ